jgi:sugar/nucleoside kinase (ribokinase family)
MAKVLGIGNALVDIIILIDDDRLLEELALPKGSMQLVDIEKSGQVRKASEHLDSSFASGGSAANTIHGLAKLGVETTFIGKVGDDDYGNFFKEDLEKNNITPKLFLSETHSGRAVALISPDSERTFATHLGAAIELCAGDLDTNHFRDHDYFHIEGYLVQNNELLEKAVRLAKENDMIISLDLASYNIVDENLDFLKYIVKEYVDIIFANEEEAMSFTGKAPLEALHELATICRIAIVKTGKDGSLVKSGDDFHKIGVTEAKVTDTNGAGDIYAAGFLYGLSKGWALDKCGQAGAILAGKVIEILGPKLDEKSWTEVLKQIHELH